MDPTNDRADATTEASAAPEQETEHQTGDIPVTSSPAQLHKGFTRLLRLWSSLQVSYYGGKYSIERSLALDEYMRTTSLTRVLFVCIGTPLPMLLLVILQELLPLQDPADGWRANYGFWIRVLMLSAVTATTFLIQGTFMVNGFTLSWRQLAVFMTILSLIHTAASMIVSAVCFFPIPFFYITMTPSFYIPLFLLLSVMLRERCVNCMCYIATQKVMGMVYPAYQLLFHTMASTHYILPVVLLQPVIKLVAKNVVLHFTKNLEDLTPEAVIFTVDFYNSLYLATFMETASSLTTMLLLIGTDVAQTLLVLLKMRRRTDTILQRLCQVTDAFTEEDLLAALRLLCQNQDKLATQTIADIRVRSCLSHDLSPADNNLLFLIEKSVTETSHLAHCWPNVNGSIVCSPKYSSNSSSCLEKLHQLLGRRHLNAVHPTRPNTRRSSRLHSSELCISRENSRLVSATRAQYANTLNETLAVLYTMECLVLTAYLEAFIPLFYGNYMIIMVNFPNAKYHTDLKNVTRQNVNYTATIVFLFGLVQLVSFALLAALIRRKCRLNVLYQLAFVLETQMVLVQGKLMIWMLVTLACRVAHFGVDYSFKFAWVYSTSNS